MHYVIGSGPAGVACARALLQRGLPVTLLDGGETLESQQRERLDQLGDQPPASWSAESLSSFRDAVQPDPTGVPMKRTHGSDFPYRGDPRLPTKRHGADILSSLAVGGLSNVWGANIYPFMQDDLAAWPIGVDDLAPHYRAVLEHLPYAATEDELAEVLPLHAAPDAALRPGRQAEGMLQRWRSHAGTLRQAGVHFGQSRLAVQVAAGAEQPGCVYCGNCLYGCPYELIHSSAHQLPDLARQPDFHHRTGVLVERVEEAGGRVRLQVRDRASDTVEVLEGDRVFVGCGTVETARLVLASREAWNHPVTIRDSQYFLLPFLRGKGCSEVRDEALHTLSQLVLEIRDPEVTETSIHLLAYTYSDMLERALTAKFGGLYRLLRGPAAPLIGRLIVLQGYLHSDVSPSIRVTLDQPEGDAPPTLHLTGEPHDETRPVVDRLVRKLGRLSGALGGRPVGPMMTLTPPGKSYHAGAVFPMAAEPGEWETDTLGRLPGWSRIHLVDASCFSSVPATNVTLTVMANAHRIAHAAGEDKT